jgi:hypothetical protein
VPTALASLLASNSALGEVVLEEVIPEFRVAIDNLPGEPRNADLVAMGRAGSTQVAVSVEAKAEEPFGEYVGEVLNQAATRIARGERTNVPQRAQALSRALLGVDATDASDTGYQLLTATAGALAYGRHSGAAVLVIHEFVSSRVRAERLDENAADLSRFVARLSKGVVQNLEVARLEGPFRVPGNEHVPGDVALYVGKIQSYVP